MKVILLQDVENVGKKYEIRDVKTGYAKNFLIPKGLAKIATKENLEWLKAQKELAEKRTEEELKKFQKLASEIDGQELLFHVKVGEEGQVFDSVTPAKISKKLKEMGFGIKKSQIRLAQGIKELGEFPVKISFPHNLEAEITVIVEQG